MILRFAQLSTHQITIFTNYYDKNKTYNGFQNVDLQVVGDTAQPNGFLKRGLIYGLGSLRTDIPTDAFDLLIISEAGLGCLATIKNNSCPIICLCHTPLRVGLTEFRSYYSNRLSKIQKLGLKISLPIYKSLESSTWSRFDHIIANSVTTKNRIIREKLIDEQNISIAQPGPDVADYPSKTFKKLILYPSRFTPYKRQRLAMAAFKAADLDEYDLVLVGSKQDEDYFNEIREVAPENVQLLTNLTDSELMELYRKCYAVLYTPLKEDWGLVPLEAASHGKPVVGVNEGGVRESIIHEKTGLLTDPDTEALANSIQRLAIDEELTRKLGFAGWVRAHQFRIGSFVDQVDSRLKSFLTKQNS